MIVQKEMNICDEERSDVIRLHVKHIVIILKMDQHFSIQKEEETEVLLGSEEDGNPDLNDVQESDGEEKAEGSEDDSGDFDENDSDDEGYGILFVCLLVF